MIAPMAQIIISGDELVHLLEANGQIPDQVTKIQIHGEEIRVRIRTPWPVLKSIPVGMRFVGFEDGQAILHVITNRLVDKFDWLVDKMVASFPVEEQGARWEYPRLYIDVNKLLGQQVRGLEVTSVVLEDGRFHITTIRHPQREPREDTAPDTAGDVLPGESGTA